MSLQKPENLHELMVMKIKVLYDAEQQLVKALPKMAEAATDPDLKSAFEEHLTETKQHVSRLEEIFKKLDIAPNPETSEGIRGLVADASWIIENIKHPQTLDASLIAAAQYVEHFEIAGYGSAAEWADEMGHDEVYNLLSETLNEEETADEKLTDLATSKINAAAMDDMEEMETKPSSMLGNLNPGNI